MGGMVKGSEGIRLTPMNQIASLKLKEVGVKITEDNLPVFQLMQWGLSIGIRLTHQRTAAELLRLRLAADQAGAYKFLMTNIPGGQQTFERLMLMLSPRGAAEELLELLDMRLKANPCNPYPEYRGEPDEH